MDTADIEAPRPQATLEVTLEPVSGPLTAESLGDCLHDLTDALATLDKVPQLLDANQFALFTQTLSVGWPKFVGSKAQLRLEQLQMASPLRVRMSIWNVARNTAVGFVQLVKLAMFQREHRELARADAEYRREEVERLRLKNTEQRRKNLEGILKLFPKLEKMSPREQEALAQLIAREVNDLAEGSVRIVDLKSLKKGK